MRMIDEEEILKYVQCICEPDVTYACDEYSQYGFSEDALLDMIDSCCTIDPVHAAGVCYCRECKHFGINLENDTYCNSVNGLTDPEEDDFCSYGEIKN